MQTAVVVAAQPIGVFCDFHSQPESAVVDRMKAEIRDILRPAEIDISFRDLRRYTPDAQDEVFQKTVIIHFQGACQSEFRVSPLVLDDTAVVSSPELARTDIQDGHVLPYVNVYCNEIRAFVPAAAHVSQQQIFGRALGRVVAHELYHALLNTRKHAQRGLARSSQSPRDLTGDELSFDSRSIFALRQKYSSDKKGADPLRSAPSDELVH
jgi:hypothetical protein